MPFCAADSAAATPLVPPPTTSTSNCWVVSRSNAGANSKSLAVLERDQVREWIDHPDLLIP